MFNDNELKLLTAYMPTCLWCVCPGNSGHGGCKDGAQILELLRTKWPIMAIFVQLEIFNFNV